MDSNGYIRRRYIVADFFGHDPAKFQKDFSGIKDVGQILGQFLSNVPRFIDQDENFRIKRAQFTEDKEVNDQLFKELKAAAQAWELDPGFITPPGTGEDPKEYAAREVSSLLTAATNAGVDQKLMIDTVTQFQGGGALPEVQEMGRRQRIIGADQPQEPTLGNIPQVQTPQEQGFTEEDISAPGFPPEEQEIASLQEIGIGGQVPQDPVETTLQQIGQIPPSEEGEQPGDVPAEPDTRDPLDIERDRLEEVKRRYARGDIPYAEFAKQENDFIAAQKTKLKNEKALRDAEKERKQQLDDDLWDDVMDAKDKRIPIFDDRNPGVPLKVLRRSDVEHYSIGTDVPPPHIRTSQRIGGTGTPTIATKFKDIENLFFKKQKEITDLAKAKTKKDIKIYNELHPDNQLTSLEEIDLRVSEIQKDLPRIKRNLEFAAKREGFPTQFEEVPEYNSEEEARAAGHGSGDRVKIKGLGIGVLD